MPLRLDVTCGRYSAQAIIHLLLHGKDASMTTPATAPGSARMPFPPPQFRTSKTRYGTAIDINDWSIRADKRSILNGKEIDASVGCSGQIWRRYQVHLSSC